MNFSTLQTAFFEKRIPQNLAFVKTWQDMETAKSPAAKPQNRQKALRMQQGTRRKKLQKRSAPLVERRKIWYTILHDAPSPSGKAGDFDSPIVGSTPAGATKTPRTVLSGAFLRCYSFGQKQRYTAYLLTASIQRIIITVKECDLYGTNNGKHPDG